MTKKTFILVGFILAKFLIQYFLINHQYDLQRDEYLHLDQANHLAWGYSSIPPVTSCISFIIRLLGNSVYWIRFFPALFGALTILVVWKTIDLLHGNLFALVLGATCILLSALVRINFLFQPNSLDVLCWTAFYYLLIKYFHTEQQKWLYFAAIAFAIGFLNKYNIIFLLIGITPAILLTEHRKLFIQQRLYLSLLLCLFIISPNLVWQYQNHFPVFHHLRELADTQLVNVNRLDFLSWQVFFFVGAVPVILASLYALLCYEPFKKYRVFLWTFVFTLIAFVYLRAKSYYAIGLYPVYIAFGSVYLADLLDVGWKRYLQPILIAVPIGFYLLLYSVFYSIESPSQIIKKSRLYQQLGLLHWEDGKDHSLPQDFADMLGWKELATKIDAVYKRLPKDSHTLILCDNYGQAGAINYYTHNRNIQAVSFNADYLNWFKLDKHIDNFIRVIEFEGSLTELAKTQPFFNTAFVADSLTNPFAREYKTTIFVFMNPKIDVNQRLKTEIEKVKKQE